MSDSLDSVDSLLTSRYRLVDGAGAVRILSYMYLLVLPYTHHNLVE